MLLEDYYEDHLIASLGRETNSILISLFMASYLYHEIKQIINQIVTRYKYLVQIYFYKIYEMTYFILCKYKIKICLSKLC